MAEVAVLRTTAPADTATAASAIDRLDRRADLAVEPAPDLRVDMLPTFCWTDLEAGQPA